MNHHPPSAKRKRGSLREQPKGSSGLETVQRKDALLFTRSPIEFGTIGKHLYNPSSIEFGIGLGVNVLASDTDDGLRLDEDLDELINTFVMIESGPGEGDVEIAVSSKEINIPIESQSPSLKKKTQTKQRTRKKGTKSKQHPSQEKSSENVQTKKMRMAFVIEEEPPRWGTVWCVVCVCVCGTFTPPFFYWTYTQQHSAYERLVEEKKRRRLQREGRADKKKVQNQKLSGKAEEEATREPQQQNDQGLGESQEEKQNEEHVNEAPKTIQGNPKAFESSASVKKRMEWKEKEK